MRRFFKKQMPAHRAVANVIMHIEEVGYDYPCDNLLAERFSRGWIVSALVHPTELMKPPYGQQIFLIGDDGSIEVSSSAFPVGFAAKQFVMNAQAASALNA